MDLTGSERGDPAVVLTDARLIRRVIKHHRHLPGLGIHVPHARGYAVSRSALLAIVDPEELGCTRESLPAEVILLPRTPDDDVDEVSAARLTERWRYGFHAAIHLALERRARQNELGDAVVRDRIHRIGQTEFDEIRVVLRQDDLLLPPQDDRETYVELAALWLELRAFSPGLLGRMFPALHDRRHVDETIALDVDGAAVLARSRPDGCPPLAVTEADEADDVDEPASSPVPPARRAPSAQAAARARALADEARSRGNVVRAALLGLGAPAPAHGGDDPALAGAREDLAALAARVEAALGPEEHDAAEHGAPVDHASAPAPAAWVPILLLLAEQAAQGSVLRTTREARLLHDLQRAAIASERPVRAVDVITWITSLTRRPIVRALPLSAPIRVLQHLRHALARVPGVTLPSRERRALRHGLRAAIERAEHRVRALLRPRIVEVLAAVGLTPASIPERVAQQKLVEEMLDQVIARGFLGIGHLRDAISRNQLKLAALEGPRELILGDALLRADRLLTIALDGVYRGGEIYLRALQKISSLAFGTSPGRLLVLYLALPFGSAYVLLEGLSHVVGPIAHHLGHRHVHLFTWPAFAVTGLVLFALIHSKLVRDGVVGALRIAGRILHAIFIGLPRTIAGFPLIKRLAASRPIRILVRHLIKPAIPLLILDRIVHLRERPLPIALGIVIPLFLIANVLFNSRGGVVAEEVVVDWTSRRWRFVSRRVLPGLFHLIVDAFKVVLELLERGIYRIDEWLRFREGESVIALIGKGAIGAVWFFVAYLIRIYINLLIEPQINPIKHFPVVTVAAKIIVPMSPGLVRGLSASLAPAVGGAAAQVIAVPTVAVLPGFFGFLIWELKENWKLYRESRPKVLVPVAIGHHGETMAALLRPGLHSGTLPKLHAKLRRAARTGDASLAKHNDALHELSEAVRHFVDRELVTLLAEAPRFRSGPVRVRAIELGSNRIRIELVCPTLAATPCVVAFEEQSGLILASVPEAGFLDALPEDERIIVENALAGLYQRAAVDVVREPLEAVIGVGGATPRYDIGSEGLVIWPRKDYRSEVIYDLRRGAIFTPRVRGEVSVERLLPLTEEQVFFRATTIRWASWVAAFQATAGGDAPIPRLIEGPSLLPPVTRPA